MTYTERLFAILVLLLALSICPGCLEQTQSAESDPIPLPNFNTVDVLGNEVSDDSFQKGFVLVFLPNGDSSTDLLTAWLSEYESEHGSDTKKLIVAGENCGARRGWIVINDLTLRSRFENIFGNLDGALFKDGFLVTKIIVRAELKDSFLLVYHSVTKGYTNPLEFVQTNRPEDYLDLPSLFEKYCGEFDEGVEDIFILLISDVSLKCEGEYLVKYFDRRISGNPKYGGVVLFDDSFSREEIDVLRHNADISVDMHSLDETELADLQRLSDKNFGYRGNILFVLAGDGEKTDSLYVIKDCPFLSNYFY